MFKFWQYTVLCRYVCSYQIKISNTITSILWFLLYRRLGLIAPQIITLVSWETFIQVFHAFFVMYKIVAIVCKYYYLLYLLM